MEVSSSAAAHSRSTCCSNSLRSRRSLSTASAGGRAIDDATACIAARDAAGSPLLLLPEVSSAAVDASMRRPQSIPGKPDRGRAAVGVGVGAGAIPWPARWRKRSRTQPTPALM